ncbi:MAG: YncE family protein, partial [Candidatus Electrothrix sp. AR3]|nr:YncE family protein [Candidatus Electrothrix sp. AR3]
MGKLQGVILFYVVLFVTTLAHAGKPSTLMYVANEDSNNVMVVNLDTEEKIVTIPTGEKPHALVFAAGKAYVNNRGSEYLTVIEMDTVIDEYSAVETREISLPAISFQLALSPDGQTLAVSYKNALMVSLLDVESEEIETIQLGDTPADGFSETPMKHPHWSKDGSYLYAQNNIDDYIAKIELDSLDVVAKIAMPGSNHDLVASANDKILYAVNQNTDSGTSLTVIDTETDSIITDIIIPLAEDETGFGHHGSLSPNGKIFYFCNEGIKGGLGYRVTLIDTVNMEIIKPIEVGNGAGHAVFS